MTVNSMGHGFLFNDLISQDLLSLTFVVAQ